jgi:hypothetical protein
MRLAIAAVVVAFASCKSATTAQNSQNSTSLGRHTIVYKTRADYSKLVPVLLSEDKSKIISYPDPADVKDAEGNFASPATLADGYLLDRRGVGKNSVFLNITYEEYVMRPAMSPEEMQKLISDKEPFTEIYDCGVLSSNNTEVNILNSMIRSGDLKKHCKSIK